MFKKKQFEFNNLNKNSAFISNQKINSAFSDSKNRRFNLEDSFKRSPNEKLVQANINRHENQQQSEDSISEQSTFSFHEYKEILNNLFENGEHDEEWNQVPEILKLITKALVLSVNAMENKVKQNQQIINEQGIKIKEGFLTSQNLKKQLRKVTEKTNSIPNLKYQGREERQQSHKFFLNSSKKQEIDFYTKGLDRIMIQQVKTITDAMVSKNVEQIMNEMQQLNDQNKQKMKLEIEKIKNILSQQFVPQTTIAQISTQLQIKTEKLQNKLQQRVNLLQRQIQHLSKQLRDEKQAMLNLAHYSEEKYCSKEQVNKILKINIEQKPIKNHDHNFLPSDAILSRNKIQQIVHLQIENYSLIKRKEFQEFKERITKNINSFVTIPEVQMIVQKSSKSKIQKIQEMNQMYLKHDLVRDQQTLDFKKMKSKQIKSQVDSRQRSPVSKQKTKVTKKTSQSGLHLSKASKNTTNAKKITPFNEQITENSPIVQDKLTRSNKTAKQSNQKSIVYEMQPQFEAAMMKKTQTKIKLLTSSIKQNLTNHVIEQNQKLQKRLIKRLQSAEQQFCKVVEQNWKTMSENNLKIQTQEKQNMENLLQIFSVLNVIARYTAIVNCEANQCIKWQKEVFNARNKSFYLSGQKNLIYITSPGVYHIHVVLYTLYDPVVQFAVELNSEQVFSNVLKNDAIEDSQVKVPSDEKKGNKTKRNKTTINHPSRGTEFSETLLIPAKSHLVVRLLKELNGQALIEIRKL